MKKNTVLIIGAVWIEPNSSAAGSRMLQLIEQFLTQGWKITFCCAAQKTANATDLTLLGIEEVGIELNHTSFDDFVSKLNPSIVVFDRFLTEEQFGWRVAENCPNALRILDTEDLHCLRKTRALAVKKNIPFRISDLLQEDSTKREIAAILRCDLSLIISNFEMDLLKSTFKIDEQLLYYLPFLLDNIKVNSLKNTPSFEHRKHFVFVGNFYHKPNVDAVLFLKSAIWKRIRKELPKAEVHIYGAYATPQILGLHNPKEGFMVKGFAENAQEVVSAAKVVLAPLRFGAGLKGKLVEAMICGTPSITTAIGAEGMHGQLPWNGIIAHDFEEFSHQAVALSQDKNSWEQAQQNGVAIVNTVYDKSKLGMAFIQKITEIQQELDTHRAQNFLGSVLRHQTLQATKFMSKWIAVKNKTSN